MVETPHFGCGVCGFESYLPNNKELMVKYINEGKEVG